MDRLGRSNNRPASIIDSQFTQAAPPVNAHPDWTALLGTPTPLGLPAPVRSGWASEALDRLLQHIPDMIPEEGAKSLEGAFRSLDDAHQVALWRASLISYRPALSRALSPVILDKLLARSPSWSDVWSDPIAVSNAISASLLFPNPFIACPGPDRSQVLGQLIAHVQTFPKAPELLASAFSQAMGPPLMGLPGSSRKSVDPARAEQLFSNIPKSRHVSLITSAITAGQDQVVNALWSNPALSLPAISPQQWWNWASELLPRASVLLASVITNGKLWEHELAGELLIKILHGTPATVPALAALAQGASALPQNPLRKKFWSNSNSEALLEALPQPNVMEHMWSCAPHRFTSDKVLRWVFFARTHSAHNAATHAHHDANLVTALSKTPPRCVKNTVIHVCRSASGDITPRFEEGLNMLWSKLSSKDKQAVYQATTGFLDEGAAAVAWLCHQELTDKVHSAHLLSRRAPKM